MNKTHVITIAIVGYAASVLAGGAGAPATGDQPRFSESEYVAHLEFLASDICEGRAPGTRGGDVAAAYIAAQFRAAGLQPIPGTDSYLQPVPLSGARTEQPSVRFTLSAGGKSVSLTPIEEVVVASEQAADEIHSQGELVFVGYGIEAPELDWDDYKGTDVAGKILVMLVNDPDLEKTGFYGESLSYYGRWTYKEEIARKKKAKGLLLLHTTETATYPFAVVQNSWATERLQIEGERTRPLGINGWISKPAIDKALGLVGSSYAELQEKADSRELRPFPLGLTLDASFEQRRRSFTSPNVVGVLPGTTRGDEAVVYSAHYDHFGIGRPIDDDPIYNGARDNASGTAALISLARAFAEMPAPQRSVIFFATTGEESGLLGSEYYVAHPVVPLAKTVMAVNVDVFNVYGPAADFAAGIVQYTDAVTTIAAIGEGLGLDLNVAEADKRGGAFRSDHFPFCARGVVALSVGTGRRLRGLTEEQAKERFDALFEGRYHQPSDEIDPRWRYDGSIQALNLVYRVGRHWADGAAPPSLLPDNPFVPALRMRGGEGE